MSDHVDAMLIVSPFASIVEPTIGVSLLKAMAKRAGFTVSIRYFSLDFAEFIGISLYQLVGSTFASKSLVGDWIFSDALFGKEAIDADSYVSHLLASYSKLEDGVPYGANFDNGMNFTQYIEKKLLPEIRPVRQLTNSFVKRCSNDILRKNPKVVGFTSSCHQACSSLAIARRLKESPNPPVIIFGGANCHGEMGLQWLRSFPWIDYICTGEGDEVFPTFLERFFRKGEDGPFPGILKQGESHELTLPNIITDLDSLPMPSYSDYFEQLEKSPALSEIRFPRLPIETSRGCLWGQGHQCVFCGNHPLMIQYRQKSSEKIVNEIKYQKQKYRFGQIFFVDDMIDPTKLEKTFTMLNEEQFNLPVFCQTRPNLTRHQLRIMKNAGVRQIQPGIESFNDTILSLMHKGSSSLQNIQLLKWCGEIDMQVSWNILYGFSGEPLIEYKRMTDMIPLLIHLHPPLGCTWIALKKFSPYWRSPESFGLSNVKPWPSYACVYPFDEAALEKLAYFFEFEYLDRRKPFEYSRDLRREVGRWIIKWQVPANERPRLDLYRAGKAVTINDTRECAVRKRHILEGISAEIYTLCDTARSLTSLMQKLKDTAGKSLIQDTLEKLIADKLIITDDHKYLSLAIIQDRVDSE